MEGPSDRRLKEDWPGHDWLTILCAPLPPPLPTPSQAAAAKVASRNFYLGTRYPNALAFPAVPRDAYSALDAEAAAALVGSAIGTVTLFINAQR